MITWRTEKRKVSELIPAAYNPRKAGEKQYNDLNASLEKFDLADPLVINTNNTVIGGHFRLKVLKDRGTEEVDVRVPDRELTQEEEQELNIRLNKNLGEWDFDALANFDLDLLKTAGWEEKELFRFDHSLNFDVLEGNKTTRKSDAVCPSCGYQFDPRKNRQSKDSLA